MVPRIDHVVVDVQDRMAEAARRYAALGFGLTEPSRHSLGSLNRLAVFAPDYLELLSPGEPGGPARADLAGFPIGLNGLVFAIEGAEARHWELRDKGLPAEPVQSFSRPVAVNGRREEARFRVVRLEKRAVFDGRVYFCEHLTPELVWRPEWQDHPNGALALARVAIAARQPARLAGVFERLFGSGAAEAGPEGGRVLRAGTVRVEMAAREALARELGDALPDPAGRADHMALLGIRVRSLARVEALLREGGVRHRRIEPDRILVHPAEAMNLALEFSE